ncbi:MAG: hypothetical protein HQM14_05690 [SAR324 cluster bacterium]|nr:hypothetical protein [SAR324 cluster bacterium]
MKNVVQLNLFPWDCELLAKGQDALNKLDFSGARKIFQTICNKISDHSTAQYGLSLCNDWEYFLTKKKHLNKIIACEFLWQAIHGYDFKADEIAIVLRSALLKMLAATVEKIDDHFFSDSGLCLGQIFSELKIFPKAISAFESLLEYYPHDPHLLVRFANTLWQANKKVRAKIYYIKALLIAPTEVPSLSIEDTEISLLMKKEGPYMTPIYEWLQHDMLPLDLPTIYGEDLEHFGALEIYYKILRVNQLEAEGSYDKMMVYQNELQAQSPEIFALYIEESKPLQSYYFG